MKRFSIGIHPLRTGIVNAITASVALGLAANRRNNMELQPEPWPQDQAAPFVEIIIPARNEERNIRLLLTSLLVQHYPVGRRHITVVDDGSQDHTAGIAQEFARQDSRITVVQATELPPGWTGKNHALWTGAQNAAPEAEWLLFVDADTRHQPAMLATVVRAAQALRADLLSLVINVEMKSFWEAVLVPQVGELYTLLVGTMDAVNKPGRATAANGQFILVRPALYRATGSLEAVRSDVAEDRALAKACKERGATVRLVYGRKLVTSRVYSSLPEMWRGYSKTLFWASGHNAGKTLLVAAALSLYGLVPTFTLLRALVDSGYAARKEALKHAPFQLLPMLALRAAVCRQMGISPLYAFAYPLSVAVGNAMLLYSLYRVVSGKGVEWKGRNYRR